MAEFKNCPKCGTYNTMHGECEKCGARTCFACYVG
jgi:rRNA maturation protein Nop10